MKRLSAVSSLLAILMSAEALAQIDGYPVSGQVIDRQTRAAVPYAAVLIVGDETSGVMTDSLGRFRFDKVKPGIRQFSAIQLGYYTEVTPEYNITPYTPAILIEMNENRAEIAASTVRPSPFLRSIESPVSIKIISIGDIDRIPGANKDIARIVRSYPGVSFSPIGYRNDLIVRGGGPSENAFFIDGIEIPNINHFATQGASGGPVSILNSDLIREIKFYTGAFPANRGGALSSVMDITLKDGNPDKQAFKATIGASEAGFSASGHIGSRTTYVASIRQSYLQLLFKVLGLPMLPNYIDGQFKIKSQLNDRNEITVIALAGIDNMKLNMEPKDDADEYLLSYLPELKQETFTTGISWKHFSDIHTRTLSLGYSYLNNRSIKYNDNDESSEENLRLRSSGMEGKATIRWENRSYYESWTLREGIEVIWRHYDSNIYRKIPSGTPISYSSDIGFLSGAVYFSAEYRSPGDRFTASTGVRADAASYSDETAEIWKQLSPRVSVSYRFGDSWSVNASAGLYNQLPPLTALSFRNAEGKLANRELEYMRAISGAIGADWRLRDRLMISLEGFYKHFLDIPVSEATGVPLTCIGADYGSIGEELLISTGAGRAYGVELMARWMIPDKLNLIGSATLYSSSYRSDKDSGYLPSAWDNRFIVNVSAVYDFPKNWSIGAKLSAIGGAPYTPYDEELSSYKTVWDATGRPVYDYSQYNMKRLKPYTQLDIRIDKDFYFRKWTLSLYIDLENVTFSKIRQPDALLSTGTLVDPETSLALQRYKMETLELWSGTLVPALGINVEF